MLGSLNKGRQGVSVLLPSISAAASRVLTTTASTSAEPSTASGKSALNKEFQVYRYFSSYTSYERFNPARHESLMQSQSDRLDTIRIALVCRWDPDNAGKPSYQSYDVDINRWAAA